MSESYEVAFAIREHYLPNFPGDNLPVSGLGISLAIADRMDNIVAKFGTGKHPTGDKDPFALRRQALAILNIIIEKNLPLDLNELIEMSIKLYTQQSLPIMDSTDKILDFFFERLRTFYNENNMGRISI